MTRQGDLSDAKLLRLIVDRDGLAMEEIVVRYDRLVRSVCCRILRDPAAAEDAIQATRIVLWRAAGEVDGSKPLGGYLHTVATRIAVRERSRAIRRQASERRAAEMKTRAGDGGGLDSEYAAILHEEISRLNEKFRLPIILCELEGRTRTEAAEALHIPAGTVASRLSTAREKLRARLVRRGIVMTASVATVARAGDAWASAAQTPAAAREAARAVVSGRTSAGAEAMASRYATAASLARARTNIAASCAAAGVVVLAALALVAPTGAGRSTRPGGLQARVGVAGFSTGGGEKVVATVCVVRQLGDDGQAGPPVCTSRISFAKLERGKDVRFNIDAWSGRLAPGRTYEALMLIVCAGTRGTEAPDALNNSGGLSYRDARNLFELSLPLSDLNADYLKYIDIIDYTREQYNEMLGSLKMGIFEASVNDIDTTYSYFRKWTETRLPNRLCLGTFLYGSANSITRSAPDGLGVTAVNPRGEEIRVNLSCLRTTLQAGLERPASSWAEVDIESLSDPESLSLEVSNTASKGEFRFLDLSKEYITIMPSLVVLPAGETPGPPGR